MNIRNDRGKQFQNLETCNFKVFVFRRIVTGHLFSAVTKNIQAYFKKWSRNKVCYEIISNNHLS